TGSRQTAHWQAARQAARVVDRPWPQKRRQAKPRQDHSVSFCCGRGHGYAALGRLYWSAMNEVTRILSVIEHGDPQSAEQLLPVVYDELRQLAARKLAHEKPGQTLQATALVHEAYLRLVDVKQAQHWNSRGHFFAAAAEAMRRILVEHARRKGR